MSESLSSWLALREQADRAARSVALAQKAVDSLPAGRAPRVLDLAAGTGANLKYLWPFLSVPQQWLLVDVDPALLAEGVSRISPALGIRIETRAMNLGPLDHPEIFIDRDLVTASALLDLVSEEWLQKLAGQCRIAGASALFALTYDGRSTCTPADPEDEMIRELFNQHQRNNDKGFGKAAGPGANDAAERCFRAEGYRVIRERTDWKLASDSRELQQNLFTGWAQAALETAPDRACEIADWMQRRLKHLDSGRSRVTVGHEDLLAVPR